MSLTSHLKTKGSPVRDFLTTEFPNTTIFLRDARTQVRQAETIRPTDAVPRSSMGTALDYRLRYYFDATPFESLAAYKGAVKLSEEHNRVPFDARLSYVVRADYIDLFDRATGDLAASYYIELNAVSGGSHERQSYILNEVVPKILEEIASRQTTPYGDISPAHARFFTGLDNLLQSINPAKVRLTAKDENELNRYCVVLAELEEAFRSGRRRLTFPDDTYDWAPSQLLELVEAHWLDDLRELSWLFYDRCSHLLSAPVTLNPTFAGGRHVGEADADLIVDGTLLEVKATVKDQIQADYVWQLLGYVLLDYGDEHKIRSIGIYMARQGLLFQWDLLEAISVLSGTDSPDLENLRDRFKEAVTARRFRAMRN